MKKFKVMASYTTFLEVVIEAESLEQAEDLAEDLDGGSFTQVEHGDWEIYAVQELSEAA